MKLVRKQSILLLNQILQTEFGGYFQPPNNLQNEAALDYILEAIASTIYERELYPGLFSKASALMCTIIKQHVFRDGNKRTGIEAARLLLAKNDYLLRTHPDDADYVLLVADCTVAQDTVTDWLRTKSILKTSSIN